MDRDKYNLIIDTKHNNNNSNNDNNAVAAAIINNNCHDKKREKVTGFKRNKRFTICYSPPAD